ncbi:MAG: molybdenum cofactor guanylyltransferase [Pirellulaceae bacterium]
MARIVGVLILAGGASSRMGMDKAELRFGGITFLERLVAEFQEVWGEVAVVTRCEQQARLKQLVSDASVVWLADRESDVGPLEGLAVGMSYFEEQFSQGAVFVLPVDMPGVRRQHGECLLERYGKREAVVMFNGVESPFWYPFLMPVGSAEFICQHVKNGGRRLRDVLTQLGIVLVEYSELCRMEMGSDSLFSVNDPTEYARLTSRESDLTME